MNVIKRDCTEVEFNKIKIYNAIIKAMPFGEGVKEKIAEKIANEIEEELKDKNSVEIYKIEAMVFDKLIPIFLPLVEKNRIFSNNSILYILSNVKLQYY